MNKVLLTPQEASQRYSISYWTLYRWALEGKIKSRKIGKLRRFVKRELDDFFGVDDHEKESSNPNHGDSANE